MVQQTTIQWNKDGANIGVSLLHWSDTSDPDSIGLRTRTAIDQVMDLVSDTYSASFPPEVTQIDTATGELTGRVSIDPPAPITGRFSGEPLPDVAQLLLRHRTSTYLGGRLLQGRLYLPGVGGSFNSNGEVNGSVQEQVTAYSNILRTAGVEAVVWSRKNGSVAPITAVTYWTEWATQRRRRNA